VDTVPVEVYIRIGNRAVLLHLLIIISLSAQDQSEILMDEGIGIIWDVKKWPVSTNLIEQDINSSANGELIADR